MRIEKQFTTFLENKPGRLLNICAALARDKVNIRALTVMDSKEHSVLRFVVDKVEQTTEALRRLNAPFSETDVIVLELKHQPGAIARLCERLAAEHVNIDYIYCSSGAKNGQTIAVIKGTPTDKLKTALADGTAPKPPRLPARPRKARKVRV